MYTGIFISYTSAHYQPLKALVYWRKFVLNVLALLERKNIYHVSYLTTLYFVLFYQRILLAISLKLQQLNLE